MFNRTFFLVIKINRKIILAIIALILLLLSASLVISNKTAAVFNTSKKTITVDPGHGGIDGGSSSFGLLEKDVNLQISLKLRKTLVNKGIHVVLTRDSDVSLESKSDLNSSRYRRDLHARKTIIDQSNSAAFVSVHMDAYKNSNARGIKIFYYETSNESKQLAQSICDKVNKMVFNEFLKTTEVKAELGTGDYYLLRTAQAPGVIVETGFITNPTDNSLIQREDYQNIIAKAIADGIEEYLFKAAP
ncbi:N-acetylmuramoyl-L-alanine amidase family protein [Alkaliphilus oremlandii]|uniref:Cell wall hydrolase/autolysin n=1 Tax=Alkaliphilus oremlandii (strain OhILAs) TaxID=350688 RepID=A8MIX1_ALKOO|nr:N-acetylmuramoyl-L-alanine amidase [Alkaliphilus oremlandii]ABW19753.1 cell wall hydrolase/autolysin [Alkaliphilus oremlandii OhILAs]